MIKHFILPFWCMIVLVMLHDTVYWENTDSFYHLWGFYEHNQQMILHILKIIHIIVWDNCRLGHYPRFPLFIHWVRGAVLCLCLKVIQPPSANHSPGKPSLILQFLFSVCSSPPVTMTTELGAVGYGGFGRALHKQMRGFPLMVHSFTTPPVLIVNHKDP